MRWESTQTNTAGTNEYRLFDDGQCRAIVRFSHDQKSIRISCNDEKRLFFMERAGLLNNRIVFTNEYGYEIGKLKAGKWSGNTCEVEIEDKRYYIIWELNPDAVLCIYENRSDEPVLKCNLDMGIETPGVKLHAAENEALASLLMAVCWYLFFPVSREHALGVA